MQKIWPESGPVYDLTAIDTGLKKGVWGESRLVFESIVEEVRRFVARMPPSDLTTGSACCSRSFSALGDQRAEILPVQQPPALAVGGRCMMRLTRILMFPFFSLSIMKSATPTSRCLSKCPENFPWKLSLEGTRVEPASQLSRNN